MGNITTDNITSGSDTTSVSNLIKAVPKAYAVWENNSSVDMNRVRNSLNTASLTDEGTGNQSYTFTNNFSNNFHLTLSQGNGLHTSSGYTSSDVSTDTSQGGTYVVRTNGSRLRHTNSAGSTTDSAKVHGYQESGDLA